MHDRLKFVAWLAAVYGSVLATAAAVVVLLSAGMPAEVQSALKPNGQDIARRESE